LGNLDAFNQGQAAADVHVPMSTPLLGGEACDGHEPAFQSNDNRTDCLASLVVTFLASKADPPPCLAAVAHPGSWKRASAAGGDSVLVAVDAR